MAKGFEIICVTFSMVFIASNGATVSAIYPVSDMSNLIPQFAVKDVANTNQNIVYQYTERNQLPQTLQIKPKLSQIRPQISDTRQAVSFQRAPYTEFFRENHFLPRPQSNQLFGHQQYQTQHEHHLLPSPGHENRPSVTNIHTIQDMNSARPVFQPPHHQVLQHPYLPNSPTISKPDITIKANNVYINKDDHKNTAAWHDYLVHRFNMMKSPNAYAGQTIYYDHNEIPDSFTNVSRVKNIPKLIILIMASTPGQGGTDEIEEKGNIYGKGIFDRVEQTGGRQMSSQAASNQGHIGNNPTIDSLPAVSELKEDKTVPTLFHPLLSVIKGTKPNISI